ncbi:MAG: Tfx family DNA-binding protein [Nitrososphaerota archaeon]
MKRRILLTPRQIEVLRLRRRGFTQEQIAEILKTSRENISIIEKNAYRMIKAAKSTLEAFESLDSNRILTIPAGTSIYDAPRIIFVRGDILGIKIKSSADRIISMIKSTGKVRGHHLISPIVVEIYQDGKIFIQ